MRLVEWTDGEGYRRLSYVRNSDPDDLAPQGLPCATPDLDALDWERIKREVHNLLVSKRLLTWDDVIRSQNGITSIANATLKRELIILIRNQKTEE